MDLLIVRHQLSMDGNRTQPEFLRSQPSPHGIARTSPPASGSRRLEPSVSVRLSGLTLVAVAPARPVI